MEVFLWLIICIKQKCIDWFEFQVYPLEFWFTGAYHEPTCFGRIQWLVTFRPEGDSFGLDEGSLIFERQVLLSRL